MHIQQSFPNYLRPYQIFIVSTVPTSNLTYVTAGRDAGIKNFLDKPTAPFLIALLDCYGGPGACRASLFRRPYNFYAVIEFEYSPINDRIQKCFLREQMQGILYNTIGSSFDQHPLLLSSKDLENARLFTFQPSVLYGCNSVAQLLHSA